MKRSKSGYPSRAKNAFNPPVKKYQDPVKFLFTLERELRDDFIRKFPGRCSEILVGFIQEAVKMNRTMVFEIAEVENSEGFNPTPYPGCHVFQLNPDTKEIIAGFASLTEAAKATGINRHCIWRVCKGNGKLAGKFAWSWRIPGPQRKPKGNSLFGNE